MSPTAVTTLSEASQNSHSPNTLAPQKFVAEITTRNMVTHTATLTSAPPVRRRVSLAGYPSPSSRSPGQYEITMDPAVISAGRVMANSSDEGACQHAGCADLHENRYRSHQ